MTDKLGWIVAGVLVALIVGYVLGRRHGEQAGFPSQDRLPGPGPAALPSVDEAPPPAPAAEPLRRPGAMPPPAPAGHLPPGTVVASGGSASGGSFLGGARPPVRPATGTPARPPVAAGPPAPSAPAPPARTSDRGPAPQRPPAAAPTLGQRPSLVGVQSWGYQLQRLDLGAMAASPYDLIVIDRSRDGSDEGALRPAEVERLKQKPDGGRRFVFAYLSIGEAESYRGYWQEAWKRSAPPFLLGENPDWEENYAVRFWMPQWQSIIFGSPEAYLDRIVAQGFDGVYLDKCDVTEDLEQHFPAVARERADLARDMVDFVIRLAAHARRTRPDFAVIMQNAEPLLRSAELRSVIDGVGKEELYFGLDGGEGMNEGQDVEESRSLLALVRAEGKGVLVVEYLGDRAKMRRASELAAGDGFVLFLSGRNRELATLGSGPVVA